ncbi:MAG: PAS domain-containing protein, partial [Candidatus Electrothrix sp. ATG2]|nr:PAS domain-containing protein [Candidatus Electrothrix sp. ATG2]
IQDIVLILAPDLRVLKANSTAEQYLEAAPDELEGRKCFELFRKTSSPCQGCPALKTLRDCKPYSSQIEHEEMKCFFLISSSPIFNDAGKLIGLVYVVKDITRQKQLEVQMRQAQKMEAVGTLAGGIAHDFNNILSPILGYSEMLTETLPKESTEGQQIQQIYKAAIRARDLVKQILGFSRQSEQTLQPVEPHLILKEVLKLLRSTIPTSIEIKERIDITSGKIMADPTQLHQVVVNLCTNAYQAMMETGGTLGVAMKSFVLSAEDVAHKVGVMPGSYIQIEVSDTGIGIEADVIEKIFEPYFTTKKEEGGTGLGLATVHAIVHEHGGSLSVYSEPGIGTTF